MSVGDRDGGGPAPPDDEDRGLLRGLPGDGEGPQTEPRSPPRRPGGAAPPASGGDAGPRTAADGFPADLAAAIESLAAGQRRIEAKLDRALSEVREGGPDFAELKRAIDPRNRPRLPPPKPESGPVFRPPSARSSLGAPAGMRPQRPNRPPRRGRESPSPIRVPAISAHRRMLKMSATLGSRSAAISSDPSGKMARVRIARDVPTLAERRLRRSSPGAHRHGRRR